MSFKFLILISIFIKFANCSTTNDLKSAPKSPIVKNLNEICLCRGPMIENLKFQFPNHVDKISNRFDDNEETFDSSALVSLANGEKRIFCFKNDGITSRLKIKSRKKRYAIEGSYWDIKQISYSIRRASQVLPEKIVKRVIRKAFDVWEKASTLKFTYKPYGKSDIEILFAKGEHGDGEPFDGQGKVLAHAFFPRYGGDIHFDSSEKWSPNKYGPGLDLYAVAVHEIGHALGLKHSKEIAAIMAPFYQSYTGEALHLHQDDIMALKRLYGKLPLSHEGSDWHGPPNLCNDFKIDAISGFINGTIHAFSGEYFYTFHKTHFDTKNPKKIDKYFPGIDGNLDAIVTDSDNDSYFFKGSKYWLINDKGMIYQGYPRFIHDGFVDMPKNLDAGLVWKRDDNAYFFKNDKYWKYSPTGMPKGYPKPISSLFPFMKHPPQKIDAAVTFPNGDSYLLSGDHFYKLYSHKFIVTSGYPRRTSSFWFNCHKPNQPRMIENKRFLV